MPLGGRDAKPVIEALERNKKFLRGEIAHRVNLKFAPDIRFRLDERFDEAERIEKILRTPRGPARPRSEGRRRGPMSDDESDRPIRRCRPREEQAAQAREARRARLGRARQAGRHDLDPCGRGDQARCSRRKRAGHAGTLDPLASGCLPIALGEATKTVPFVMDGRKRYRFTVRWGEERDTDDAEGKVVAHRATRARTRTRSAPACRRFTGTIAQVPPRFSAIKIEGERAYDLARDGEEVDAGGPSGRDPRPGARSRRRTPIMRFSRPNAARAPMCGRWRAISGALLGCLGHVAALRRTQVGPFGENDMISLEELEALCQRAAAGEGSLADALLPVETALDDIPALAVSRADAARLQRGQAVLLRGRDAPIFRGTVYVTASGELIALAEVDRGEIVPKRVFNLAGLKGSAGKRQGH